MSLTRDAKLRIWLIVLAVFIGLLILLRSMLLPFVAGMAVSYFLDPLANRLERAGLSRPLATTVITLFFFLAIVLLLAMAVPLIESQVVGFIQKVPSYAQALIHRGEPLWRTVKTYLSPHDIDQLQNAASGYAGTLAEYIGRFFTRVVTGSLQLMNVLSLIIITPVVTFYLLRDWQKITSRIDSWLPRPYAPVIRSQLEEIDRILSGFVRGQAMVCLSLGLFYGLGLTAIGVDLGLVVGLSAGLLSFVPYLGTLTGFLTSIGLALAQSTGWTLPGLVVALFIVGNLLESYILSPKLVGEKIGLHPVWVIFALLAGGALFGFLGILLALPVSAVIGVLTRFSLVQYMNSSLYSGDMPKDDALR